MWWRLCVVFTLIMLSLVSTASAQDSNSQAYENTELGISFELPANWTEQFISNRLTLGPETELQRINTGLPPQSLVLSVVMGTYSDLQLASAGEIVDRVRQLVPSTITAPDPYEVTYGNASGYETEFIIEDSALITRVTLLASTDGRIAIIRGTGPVGTWDTVHAQQLDAILATTAFITSDTMASPLANVDDSDGGVQWHYQLLQGRDQLPIELGGVAVDSGGVVYVAAGPRGFIALQQDTGQFINVLGPIFANDNFVDVALSPDERLYFANATDRAGRRIMIIDRAGNYINAFGLAGDEPGQFAPNMPRTITITDRGEVWAASEGHATEPVNRLYRFDATGNLLGSFDMDAISEGLSNVHIEANRVEDRIYVVGETGGFHVLTWGGEVIVRNLGRDFLDTAQPTDITISPLNGNLIFPTINEGFVVINPQGVILDRFGYPYDSERGGRFFPAEYLAPTGVATLANGFVFFAETNPETGFAQVQAFTFTGEGTLPIAQRTPPITDAPTFSAELSEGGEISYGISVRGLLNSGSTRHDYTFFANAGDTLTITMRKVNAEGSLDTWLFLFDGNYNELLENDDVVGSSEGLTSTDSVITYTVPSNGTYIVRATRFGGDGVYELVITR